MAGKDNYISRETQAKLAEHIGRFRNDPYGFVMFVFPWGDPQSSLRDRKGPEEWQALLLKEIGRHCQDNHYRKLLNLDYKVWRSVVASGHGVGKSAIVAWVIYWIMSTRPNARGAITANTGTQLETKTWPELAKWHSLAINNSWFEWTSTSFYFKQYDADKRKNYMMNAITVSEETTEAFAGLHNADSAVLLIMDEASGIHKKVWEVGEGALTDGEPFFLAFGNPTRPDGEFFDCFHEHKHLYWTLHVDSRSVYGTNKIQLQNIIDKFGADSDEAKVRVYGQFPNQAFDGFISPTLIDEAMEREDVHPDFGAPLIMGVDVAAMGGDTTVISWRQGLNGRILPWERIYHRDEQFVAKRCAELIGKYGPDAVVIEMTGPGAGVIALLKSWNYRVFEYHPGARCPKDSPYYNRRAEAWVELRSWLVKGGALNRDPALYKQLATIRYSLDNNTEQKTVLESKKDMRSRGLPSPDDADSFASTFAVTPARRDQSINPATGLHRPKARMAVHEYDEIAY